MDLASLIASRQRATGVSLREMEKRAREAGHPISRSAISDYANGKTTTHPPLEKVHALAAALDTSYEEVAAAVHESFGVDAGDTKETGRAVQQANAWLRLTANRTESEIEDLLLIVDTLLRLQDKKDPQR